MPERHVQLQRGDHLVGIDCYGLYSVFIPVYVFLLLASVAAMRQETTDFMARVAEIQ